MKRNKIASLMLTGILAASMAVPAFAVDITMDGTGKTYEAYKLLDLTTSLKLDHATHDGDHSQDCYNYSYTLNGNYSDIIKSVLGVDADTRDDVIVSQLEGKSEAEIREFANKVYEEVVKANKAADKTSEGKTISVDGQGYYMIVEKEKDADPDTYSLVMLDTAGQENITVKTKEGVPELTKKIIENGSKVDAADYKVGDTVSFELTGTMPDNIDGYKTYKYIFHDTLSAGLELKADTVKVAIDGTEVAADAYTLTQAGLEDGCSFELGFADIKDGRNITKDTKVVVTYDAVLKETAKSGTAGNENTAHLEFSNNPNYVGEGETTTSKTPGDKVAAFTFDVVVNKVDKDNKPIEGAQFKLQVWDGEKYVDSDRLSNTEDNQTKFTFHGLDSGKYKLIETVVPNGYNKADDVEFEIVSEMNGDDEDADEPALTALKVMQGDKELSGTGEDAMFTINLVDGSAMTNVVNLTGIKLPSTGGMGTYVIYGGGAALVAGGIALAVIKKKNSGTAD